MQFKKNKEKERRRREKKEIGIVKQIKKKSQTEKTKKKA